MKISKVIIATITIFFFNSHLLFSQLKVTNDGRIMLGSILNPSSANKVTILGGTLSCLNMDGTSMAQWGQVCKSVINNVNVMSYVVHSNISNTDVFYVNGSGDIYYKNGWVTSDSTFKRNIVRLDHSLDRINRLQGVSYNFKDNANSRTIEDEKKVIGLIAQEVEKVVPEAVKTMKDGTKAINYQSLIGLLIEGIKEQQNQINSLQQVVEYCCDSKKQNTVSTPVIGNTSSTNEALNKQNILYQNSPNPFSVSTKIKYTVAPNSQNSMMHLFDMQGVLIKSYELGKNDGEITINGGELKAGMYIYSLIVDGVEIDTKRMILTK